MYQAQVFELVAPGAAFQTTGTHDGKLDFAVRPPGGRGLTVQITPGDAELLIRLLTYAISDVRDAAPVQTGQTG